MRILILSFEFPPLRSGGVFRPLAMAKYFSECNIETTVITLETDSYPLVYDRYSIDDNLNLKESQYLKIIRVPVSRAFKSAKRITSFFNIFFSIHGQETKYWHNNAKSTIIEIIKYKNPTHLLCTAPPFGVLKLANEVSKTSNIPLIVDMRDAWSQWRVAPYGSYFHYLFTLYFERKYLKQASLVVATSEVTLNDFKKLHKRIDPSKFLTILNGYDGPMNEFHSVDFSTKQKITIGYVGSFYFNPSARQNMLMPWYKKKGHRIFQYSPQKQDWLYRSPYFFLKAIKKLKTISPETYEKVEIKFLGRREDWLNDMVTQLSLEEKVFFLGEKSREESIEFQKSCDFLLITSSKRIGGLDYSIAGKTFEYIQIQKPIISFVCNGAQKNLLMRTGLAHIFNPDDLVENVLKLHSLFNNRSNIQINSEFCDSMSRNQQLRLLLDAIQNHVGVKNDDEKSNFPDK
jgi:glycosyltransferase involved in cell wall biosynthesis